MRAFERAVEEVCLKVMEKVLGCGICGGPMMRIEDVRDRVREAIYDFEEKDGLTYRDENYEIDGD